MCLVVCLYNISTLLYTSPKCLPLESDVAVAVTDVAAAVVVVLLLVLSQYFRFSMRRSKAQVKYLPMWHFSLARSPGLSPNSSPFPFASSCPFYAPLCVLLLCCSVPPRLLSDSSVVLKSAKWNF